MKKTNRFRIWVGNILIALSLLIFLFIYYPYIMLFVSSPKLDNTIIGKGIYIQIPKINAQAPIIKNVNPWNQTEYRIALENGVAHAKQTAFPPEKGTVYLFAHSSDVPWRISRYNTVFLKIGELQNGDIIKLFENGKEYRFEVFDKKTVWPNETKYLRDIKQNQLILQTCTPIGTALQRLLVFARPVY